MRTKRGSRALLLTAMALAAGGCHHSGDGHGSDGGLVADGGSAIQGLTAITVTPADVTLTISGNTPASQVYSAMGTFSDGHSADVTHEVQWALGDGTLGSFAGNAFTSTTDHGGGTSVLASAGGIQGSTGLNLVFSQVHNDPGSPNLPANPGGLFAGGAPTTTDLDVPRLVYPDDNVLVPPNLGQLEIHFTPGGDGSAQSPNTLFEISFENKLTDVKVYARCPAPPTYGDTANTPAALTVAYGCIYTPDATVWEWIAETNRGSDPVTVMVRGTDDAGTNVGSSGSVHVSFSFDDIEGALYYWEIGDPQPCVYNDPPSGHTGPGCADNGSNDATAIVRYDFAGTDTTGTTFLTPTTPGSTGGTCIGCHALSHDGKHLIAEAGGQYDARLLLWDVAMQSAEVPFGQVDRSLFESWSPDGSQFVGVNNFSTNADQDATAGGTACTSTGGDCDLNLRLYDGTTGKFVADVPGTSINNLATDHPDWSLDGKLIAYDTVGVQPTGGTEATLQEAWNGTLYGVQQNALGWGTPFAIATPPDDHTSYYYPAIAPDSSIVVFDRAVCAPGAALDSQCWFDTAPTSRLFGAVPAAGATLVELANANKPGPLDTTMDITNTYPKWSPFVFQRTSEIGSRLMWLTFASKRHFGLRAAPALLSRNAPGDLLWMVGVDPDAVASGSDGSFVSFALPFQRLFKSNHIAQWTTKVIPPVT